MNYFNVYTQVAASGYNGSHSNRAAKGLDRSKNNLKKFNKTLFLHHFKYKNLVTFDNVCGLISGLLIISDNSRSYFNQQILAIIN